MRGRIRSDKNLEVLMALLKKANKRADHLDKPKVKVFYDDPTQLDDDQLLNVADYLREERAALAEKLIKAGMLEPDWLERQNKSKH